MVRRTTLGRTLAFSKAKHGIVRVWPSYLFLLPLVVVYFTFLILPVIRTTELSFYSASLIKRGLFVGVRNYVEVFSSPRFVKVIGNTLIYTGLSVVFTLGIALVLAVVVESKLVRFKTVFKIIFFLPAVTSWVAIGYTWKWIYEPSFGLANLLMQTVGLPAQGWISATNSALLSVIIVNVWGWFGYFMVILSAYLQLIDPELYEAATIDGANALHQFRFLTLPLLKPGITVALILGIANFFRAFMLVFIMTGGGPGQATELMAVHVYNKAFTEGLIRYGYASAASIILFLIVFSITATYRRISQEE